jgi:Protein of unknown function (DUF998)
MWRTSIWVLGGALAPLVYLIAVVLGGVLTPGYSHLAGPVSALIMTGAPAAAVLIPLFALYNALLMAFAFTMREALRDRGVHVSLIGPIALAVVALAGVLMLLYPMDPLGVPLTESGRLHVWFAGLAAFFSMVAVLFTAAALRRHPDWQGLAWYSYASFVVIAVAGMWAATTASDLSPLMGLAERVVIAAFLQWLLVIAVTLARPAPATSS